MKWFNYSRKFYLQPRTSCKHPMPPHYTEGAATRRKCEFANQLNHPHFLRITNISFILQHGTLSETIIWRLQQPTKPVAGRCKPKINVKKGCWLWICYNVQEAISSWVAYQKLFYISNPGIANWVAKFSIRFRSSIISLLLWSPFRKAFGNLPYSLCTVLAICAALRRKSATVSKSASRQPLDVIAGVPERSYKRAY